MSDTVQFDDIFGAVEPTITSFIQQQKKAIAKAPKKKTKTKAKKSEPRSKTTIGRMTYNLKTVPELYVANVKILSKRESTEESGKQTIAWVPVESRTLREKALLELISLLSLSSLGDLVAVNTKDGLGNHLIVAPQWLDADSKAKLEPRSVDLTLKRGSPKTGDAMRCEVTELIKFSGNEAEDDFYAKNLNSFVQTMHCDRLLTELISANDVIDPLAWKFLDVHAFDRSTLPNTSDKYPLRLRNQVSINVKEQVIQMDFDLVPCFPEGERHLRDILGDVFGEAVHEGNVSQYLPMLKEFFIGMDVKPNHKSGDAFKIVDLAMPESMKEEEDGKTPQYTIIEHFNQNILKNGPKLEFPGFPFVRQGKNTWHPMELVQPAKSRPLHRFDPLLPTLKQHVVKFSKLGNVGEAVVKKQAACFFEKFTRGQNDTATKRPFFEEDGEGKFTPVDLVELAWL